MIIEQHVAKICDGDLVFRKDVGDDGVDLIGKLCEIPLIVEIIHNYLIHGMENGTELFNSQNGEIKNDS